MRKRKLMKTGRGAAIPGFDQIPDVKDRTLKQYGTHVRCFLKKALKGRKMTRRRIERIRWEQVLAFLGGPGKGEEGKGDKRNYRCALKAYFTTALGMFEGEFGKLRAGKRLPRKEKDILEEAEKDSLWAVLPEQFRFLFDFLLGSGLRVQELCDLRVGDVVLEGEAMGNIFVRCGKGGKSRLTTLTTMAMAEKVAGYVAAEGLEANDRLFSNRWGKPYRSGHSLNKTLRVYCGKAAPKIKKRITCHSFRHMFCTYVIDRCDMQTAQYLMGHTSPSTTNLYYHPTFADVKRRIMEGPKEGKRKEVQDDDRGLQRLMAIVTEQNEDLKKQVQLKDEEVQLKDRVNWQLRQENRLLRRQVAKLERERQQLQSRMRFY